MGIQKEVARLLAIPEGEFNEEDKQTFNKLYLEANKAKLSAERKCRRLKMGTVKYSPTIMKLRKQFQRNRT